MILKDHEKLRNSYPNIAKTLKDLQRHTNIIKSHKAVVGNLWLVSQMWLFSRFYLIFLQINLSRLSSKYSKTANTSSKAFHDHHWHCIELSNCSIVQASDELEYFVVLCDTNAPLYASRGIPFLNIRLSRLLSQPKRFPTSAISIACKMASVFKLAQVRIFVLL